MHGYDDNTVYFVLVNWHFESLRCMSVWVQAKVRWQNLLVLIYQNSQCVHKKDHVGLECILWHFSLAVQLQKGSKGILPAYVAGVFIYSRSAKFTYDRLCI